MSTAEPSEGTHLDGEYHPHESVCNIRAPRKQGSDFGD